MSEPHSLSHSTADTPDARKGVTPCAETNDRGGPRTHDLRIKSSRWQEYQRPPPVPICYLASPHKVAQVSLVLLAAAGKGHTLGHTVRIRPRAL